METGIHFVVVTPLQQMNVNLIKIMFSIILYIYQPPLIQTSWLFNFLYGFKPF